MSNSGNSNFVLTVLSWLDVAAWSYGPKATYQLQDYMVTAPVLSPESLGDSLFGHLMMFLWVNFSTFSLYGVNLVIAQSLWLANMMIDLIEDIRHAACERYATVLDTIITNPLSRQTVLSSHRGSICYPELYKLWGESYFYLYVLLALLTPLVISIVYIHLVRDRRGLVFSVSDISLIERCWALLDPYKNYSFIKQQKRWFLPYTLPLEKKVPVADDRVLKSFRNLDYVPPAILSTKHSHASCASERAAVHAWIKQYIRGIGRKLYEVSFSRRSNAYGFHKHYVRRDLTWNEQADVIQPDSVLCMIDVDFHTDMHVWGSFGRPMVLYTFSLTTLSHTDQETTLHFDGENLQMKVRGGSAYTHGLWDYSGDEAFLGGYTYQIEKKQLRNQRAIVLLTPTVKGKMSAPLARLRTLSCGGYTTMVFNRGGVNYVDISNGDGEATSLPAKLWAALKERYAYSLKISSGDVDSALKHEKIHDYPGASILAGALRSQYGAKTSAQDLHYTFEFADDPSSATLEKVRSNDLLESPVDAVPCIPTSGIANAQAAEHLRHELQKNLQDKLPDVYAKFAEEFLAFVPQLNIDPVPVETVLERQNRSEQIRRNAQAQDDGLPDTCRVKAFMKNEAYPETKDPRNISNVSVGYQVTLSRYTIAVKEAFLKTQSWYGPGRALEDISDQLFLYCANYDKVVETDFSRFDGTISKALRCEVEFALYKKVLSPEAWKTFHRLAMSEINAPATAGRRKYDPQGSRLSGSPLTTDGNTIIGAFVDFCGNRLAGLEPAAAFGQIGLHFGDDGVSCVNQSEKAAKDLGLKLKCVVRCTKGIVGYLGRLFIRAGSSKSSLQDPARVWYKLTTTLDNNGFPELRAKWAAFLRSDPHTPYLSAFCKKALELTAEYETGKFSTYLTTVVEGQWVQRPEDAEAFGEIEREYLNPKAGLIEKIGAARSINELVKIVRDNTVVKMTVPTVRNTASDITPIAPIIRDRSQPDYNRNKPKSNNKPNAKPKQTSETAQHPATPEGPTEAVETHPNQAGSEPLGDLLG